MIDRFREVLRDPASSDRVRRAVSAVIRGRRWGVRGSRNDGRRYLDVGCGPRMHDGFIHLDYTWRPGIDICCDATTGIPLPDGSMQGIYSEHCVEHLTLDQADALLADLFRILAPGGTIRIIVPDGELYARRYVAAMDAAPGARIEPFPHEDVDGIHDIKTPMMSVNRIFTQWGHRFIYDARTLQSLLEHHGFVDVRRESFRVGRDPMLLHDNEYHVEESLYVEARRPAAE